MTQALPVYSTSDVSALGVAVDQVLAANRRTLADLVKGASGADWSGFSLRLDELNANLAAVWEPISHLNAVCNNPALRTVYTQTLAKLTAYSSELSQDKALLAGFIALQSSPDHERYDAAQRAVIQQALLNFKLGGVDLDAPDQERFRQLSLKLSELGSQFSNNVLDATQSWSCLVTDEAKLDGVPAAAKAFMRESAKRKEVDGWLLTLEVPCVQAVLTYASDRLLREEIYFANITRASEVGPDAGNYDNGPLIEQIHACRTELATLLGFNNFAELSLASKMADTPEQVLRFLRDLAQRSRPAAVLELGQLRTYAAQHGVADLMAWDQAYFSDKYREEHFAISQEALRSYFPADKVLAGLFQLVRQLYGIRVNELSEFEGWHPDVRLFEVVEEGKRVGCFYLDMFARPNKRAGAWMNGFRSRRRDSQGVLHEPMAHVVCNFTPGVAGAPALLKHVDVVTLFHEFGHCLHHLLTRVEQASVAGVSGVAWDAVELPSQFMESWCWQAEVLKLLSGHVETGEPLPDELVTKLLRTRSFQAGLAMLRQVQLGLFDFELHVRTELTDATQLMREVQAEVAVLPAPDYYRFPQSFNHVFAGGYAAGYYSYKWAEVLATDAFSRFCEEGLFNAEVGEQFRETVLAQGGAEPAMDLFVRFRGRAPQLEALLQASGLSEASPNLFG